MILSNIYKKRMGMSGRGKNGGKRTSISQKVQYSYLNVQAMEIMAEEERLANEAQTAKDVRAVLKHAGHLVLLLDHFFVPGEWLPAHHTLELCSALLAGEVDSDASRQASLDYFRPDDFAIDNSKLGEFPEASRSFFTMVIEWQQKFSTIDALLPEIFRFYSISPEDPGRISLQPIFKVSYLYKILQDFQKPAFKDQFDSWIKSTTNILPKEEAALKKFIAAIKKFLFIVLFAIKMINEFKRAAEEAKKCQLSIIDMAEADDEYIRIPLSLRNELRDELEKRDALVKDIAETAFAISGYERELEYAEEKAREDEGLLASLKTKLEYAKEKGIKEEALVDLLKEKGECLERQRLAKERKKEVLEELKDERAHLEKQQFASEDSKKRYAIAKAAVDSAQAVAIEERSADILRKKNARDTFEGLSVTLDPFFNEYACANAAELAKLSLTIQACLPGINLPILKRWLEKNESLIQSIEKEESEYLSSQLSLEVFNLTMTLTVDDGVVKVRLKNNDRFMLQDLFISLNEPRPRSVELGKKSVAQEIADDLSAGISNASGISSLINAPPDEWPYVTGLLRRISTAEENEEAFAVLGVYMLLYFQYGPTNQKELNTVSRFRLMNELTGLVKEKYSYDLPAGRSSYEKINGAGAHMPVSEDSSVELTNTISSRISKVFDTGGITVKLPSLFKKSEEVDILTVIEYIFSSDRKDDSPKKDSYPYNDRALSPSECDALVTTLTSDYIKTIELFLETKLDDLSPVQHDRIRRTADLLIKLPLEYRKNKEIKLLVILGQLLTYKQILCPKKKHGTSVIKEITDVARSDPDNIPALEFVLLSEIFLRLTKKDLVFPDTLLVKVYCDIYPNVIAGEDAGASLVKAKIIDNPSRAITQIFSWFNNEELEFLFLDAPDILTKLLVIPAKDDGLSGSLQIESIDQLFIVLAIQEAVLKFSKPIQETQHRKMFLIASRHSWFLQFRFLSIILDEKLKGFTTLSPANQAIKNSISRLSDNMMWHRESFSKWMADCFVRSDQDTKDIIKCKDDDNLLRGVIFGFAKFFSILFFALYRTQRKKLGDASFSFNMYKHFNDIVMMMGVDLSKGDPAIIFAMMVHFFNKKELLDGTGISVVDSDLSGDAGRVVIDHLKKREGLNAVFSCLNGKIKLGRNLEMGRISSDDGVSPLYKSMFFSSPAEYLSYKFIAAKIHHK